MQIDDDTAPISTKISVTKAAAYIILGLGVIGTAAYLVRHQNIDEETGKNIIRCIIDENASNLNSTACQKVIHNCSNDTSGSCQKLLFYSDVGVYSDEALTILGNICGKGGEKACDVIINRCIENNSNCKILGKPYSIKNYLAMKADVKDNGKTVMYKKIKNYYEKDVDNIVDSVIDTCINDKNSMACQIFTSKTYEFNTSEKHLFVVNQTSKGKIEFTKNGIHLAINHNTPESNSTDEKLNTKDNEQNIEFDAEKSATNKKEFNPAKKIIENTKKEEPKAVLNEEKPVLSHKASNNPTEGQAEKVLKPTVIKSCITTSEENNIDLIKNKIYSFDITYKEPLNSKIRWLVSFDGKTTWKKWNGNEWVIADTNPDVKNIDFSVGNSSSEIIKGLKDYTVQPGDNSLDFAVELMSTDENSSPSVDKVEIKYY